VGVFCGTIQVLISITKQLLLSNVNNIVSNYYTLMKVMPGWAMITSSGKGLPQIHRLAGIRPILDIAFSRKAKGN